MKVLILFNFIILLLNKIIKLDMDSSLQVFWFRRDLRLSDNHGLFQALQSNLPVLLIYIFDTNQPIPGAHADHRAEFVYDQLVRLNWKLEQYNSSIQVYHGDPIQIWNDLINQYSVSKVTFNKEYEPYSIARDEQIINLLNHFQIKAEAIKDQVIFEEDEITKADGTPYVMYTPYRRKWLRALQDEQVTTYPSSDPTYLKKLTPFTSTFPSKSKLGIKATCNPPKKINLDALNEYPKYRDYPGLEGTSNLSIHLRYGTVSPRILMLKASKVNANFMYQLIWREFFMQILFHYPNVSHGNFRAKYDQVQWENNEEDFEKWCTGQTGYPLVDAGMRELNITGHMHNRVRMVVASFLCKHLLIDWQWGEAYFAQKLYDYDLAANNGNWQWAAGTGCDAVPYFRVFNPETQLRKFDKDLTYVKKWIPEYDTSAYPDPIIDHAIARKRAIERYKNGLSNTTNYA